MFSDDKLQKLTKVISYSLKHAFKHTSNCYSAIFTGLIML